LIDALAEEIGTLPNKLAIEGHTDSVPYGPGALYTNWELSSDRANSARRLMQAQQHSDRPGGAGAGICDQRLRLPEKSQGSIESPDFCHCAV
jgi:chemotaxis protein MotB